MVRRSSLALDTNCIVRWLLRDNVAQADVVERYLKTSKTQLHVADLVFAEVAWVLKSYYQFDETLIQAFMYKLIEHDKLACNRALFRKVVAYMNTSPKVSFVDTCLVFYAEIGDARLLTFDKTLVKKFPRGAVLATDVS